MLITLIGHHVPTSEVVVLCGNTKRSPVYISFFWIIELDPRNHKPQESDEELRRTKSFYLPFPRVFMHWLCCCCFGSFTTPPPRSIIVHEIDHVMHFSSSIYLSIWDLSLTTQLRLLEHIIIIMIILCPEKTWLPESILFRFHSLPHSLLYSRSSDQLRERINDENIYPE